MTKKIVKEFKGFSSSRILLLNKSGKLVVKKEKNIQRNIERMLVLEKEFNVPKIYSTGKNFFEMEYIHGLDIVSYLNTHKSEELIIFLRKTLLKFKKKINNNKKDYKPVYEKFLNNLNILNFLPFKKNELIKKLPRYLPQTEYHGDFTLENIIYSNKNKFYLIDCSEGIFDSYIFDYSKLRQDIQLMWLLRNRNSYIEVKLQHIYNELKSNFKYMENNSLLILMLLRVLRHAKKDSIEFNFLLSNIKKLWK